MALDVRDDQAARVGSAAPRFMRRGRHPGRRAFVQHYDHLALISAAFNLDRRLG